jgi:hypothetical protein
LRGGRASARGLVLAARRRRCYHAREKEARRVRPVKKRKPVGACTICRAPTDHREMLNQRCRRIVYGRRCAGTFKSDLSTIWDECGSCEGIGKVGTQLCTECGGFGWRLYG